MCSKVLIALALLGLATSVAANGRSLSQAKAAAPKAATAAAPTAGAADTPAPAAPTPTPAQAAAAAIKAISEARGTTTNYPVGGKEGKDFPRIVGPTFKFGFKDGIGAFQGWNGGLELPKTIDLGGQRTTRSGLRGKKMH